MQNVAMKRVACIGVGMIGAGWATLFSLKGYPVKLYDAKPEAVELGIRRVEENLRFLVSKAVISEERCAASLKNLLKASSLEDAVSDVQWIQESAFESYEVKQKLLEEIDRYASPDTIIASSSSGLSIQRIARYSKYPARCIIAHPYNPVYLMPLIEIVGTGDGSRSALDTAYSFMSSLGKEPVFLKREAPGFIANRLQIAVQREICYMVYNGIASIENIDKAMTFGLALRWAIMGPSLITHLGSVNARTMIETLGKTSNVWLKDMADFKDFPDDWGDVLQAGVDEELAHRPAEIGNTSVTLREYRDDKLLEVLRIHNKLNLN